jgi:hypothetical protein
MESERRQRHAGERVGGYTCYRYGDELAIGWPQDVGADCVDRDLGIRAVDGN